MFHNPQARRYLLDFFIFVLMANYPRTAALWYAHTPQWPSDVLAKYEKDLTILGWKLWQTWKKRLVISQHRHHLDVFARSCFSFQLFHGLVMPQLSSSIWESFTEHENRPMKISGFVWPNLMFVLSALCSDVMYCSWKDDLLFRSLLFISTKSSTLARFTIRFADLFGSEWEEHCTIVSTSNLAVLFRLIF